MQVRVSVIGESTFRDCLFGKKTCGAVATHEPANKVNMCAYVPICIFHNNTGLCKLALTMPPVKMHFSAFKKKGGIREGI